MSNTRDVKWVGWAGLPAQKLLVLKWAKKQVIIQAAQLLLGSEFTVCSFITF